MKNNKIFLGSLVLMIGVLLTPFVSAEGNGEIVQIDENTLFMDYDQEVRLLNFTITPTYDTIPFNFYETDPRFSVEYSIQNRNFFELYLEDSPNGEREYTLLYCTANEIPAYDRYTYHQPTRCPGDWFKYKLRDIREGRRINIEIPPLINGTNAYWWFVGGDGAGNFSAGGGGGLPVCGGLTANVNQNETTTPLGSKFRMGAIGGYVSYSAGCTAVSLSWETWRGSSYGQIPPTYVSGTMLSGDGVVMSQNPVSFGTWYYKYPKCEETGTYNIRSKFQGYYNSKLTTVYSGFLSHTCEATNSPPSVTSPNPNQIINISTLDYTTNSSDGDGDLSYLEIWLNSSLYSNISVSGSSDNRINVINISLGNQSLYGKVCDSNGECDTTNTIYIFRENITQEEISNGLLAIIISSIMIMILSKRKDNLAWEVVGSGIALGIVGSGLVFINDSVPLWILAITLYILGTKRIVNGLERLKIERKIN